MTDRIVRELGLLAGAVRDWLNEDRSPDAECPMCRVRAGERDPGVLLETARSWLGIMTRPAAAPLPPVQPIPIDEGD
jgi:hypothetical protein